jgi:hypothetical protein
MNCFYSNSDPHLAAEALCKVLARKMIVESAQLLSTAHHVLDGQSPAYRPTHVNHPVAVWVRESAGNYCWLHRHMCHLGDLYAADSGRTHKTISDHAATLSALPRSIRAVGMTEPPQCMPEKFRQSSATQAYQQYLADKYEGFLNRGIKVEFYKKEL